MMELTPTERMLLEELIARRDAVMAPIQARLDAALGLIAERVEVPLEAMRVDLATGAISDTRAQDASGPEDYQVSLLDPRRQEPEPAEED